MTTSWTKISKASGTSWVKKNAPSKYTYDDSLVLYDDPMVQYDGDVESTGWTKVAKIVGTVYTKVAKAT